MLGINQHDLLHQHFPGDCCLCKAEKIITELEDRLKDCTAKCKSCDEDVDWKFCPRGGECLI